MFEGERPGLIRPWGDVRLMSVAAFIPRLVSLRCESILFTFHFLCMSFILLRFYLYSVSAYFRSINIIFSKCTAVGLLLKEFWLTAKFTPTFIHLSL